MASSAKIVELNDTNTCKICLNALARYSCPRCNILYCSVNCYQSPQHLECSEEFYKSCVKEELSNNIHDDEMKQTILEILKRNHQNFDENQTNLDSDDDDDDGDDTDVDIDDLEQRLNGIDLNNADEIWEKLTKNEQQDFINFLQSEQATKLIPTWQPWWLYHEPAIVELDGRSDDFKRNCPELVTVQDFVKLSQKQPADCVRYNLINILAAYVFTTRYFNGEHNDFCDETTCCLFNISLNLKNNQNFTDYNTAIKSIEMECIENDWIIADKENFNLIPEDVEKLLKGPNNNDKNYYILAALSDIKSIFIKNLNNCNKNNKPETSKFNKLFPNDHMPQWKMIESIKIKQCLKKIDYLLSYAKDKFIYE